MKRLALLVLLLFATSAHATVNEVFSRNEYVVAASGTVFPYTFKILDKVQIIVIVNGVIKNLDTDYSVSGVGDSGGGAVTFAVTPGNGASVVLIRDQPVQQLSTYTANEAFPATRLMNDLDKNIMVDQMQQEEIGRALKFDPYSLFKDVFIDTPVAGKCLAWNAARTRVINADCAAGSGGGGELPPGLVTGSALPGQVTFWSGANTIAGDTKFLWDNSTKALTVGTTPLGGPLKPGNVFIGLQAPSDATGMQALMVQTYQGAPGLAGLVTLGDDRVGISSWNFRGTGATNPIYGANFGVVFNTPGVANGLEIDVQNDSTTNYIGQALWLNGSTRATGTPGTVGHRANAILIDTQDGSKWERGILFKEGFIGGGATGSIEKMGIHFEHSQDADFIVIQPRVGQSANIAVKLTNPEFTANRFELLNSGAIRVGTTMTGSAFPSYAFVEEQTTGLYLESPSVLGFAISGPLVPGPGVGGFRRMTLGTALNIYPAAATPNNTGTLNLWDQFSTHSVGFMAPDFVGNSFRIRLPGIPGISGQCLITDGAFPISSWSYAACGTGGGGGGGTVTNSGVLALNTLVLGDGGVAVKVMASPGTTTTVLHGNATPGSPPTFGPVIVADIGATGTPSATTFLRGDGTWSTPPGTGTVITSGTPASGQVAFMTGPLAITSGPNLTWGGSGQLTLKGVAFVDPPTGVENSIQSFVTTTDVDNFHYPLFIRASSTGQMIDGFGPAIAFSATDASAVNNSAGILGFYRSSGLDNTYSFGIVTYINGVAGERFRINGTGQAVYLPTLTVGNFSLAANLTRRTELQFHTNSNINAVSLIAPATATGNHVWTLPSTFGAAGSLLSNDGTGTLSWVPGVTTSGTPASGQIAFMSGASTITSGPNLTWNGSGTLTLDGTAVVDPPTGVENSIQSFITTTAVDNFHYPLFLRANSTGQMVDGFGPAIAFSTLDASAVNNTAGIIGFYRGGGLDNTYNFSIVTYINGVGAERFRINATGQAVYLPTPTVGNFSFAANGTRKTEVQFHTDNNTNAVSLIAPATATGNHVWTLPSTFGAAGEVLTNTGGGVLGWATGGSGGAYSYLAPSTIVTESSSTAFGDINSWRPYERIILNDITNTAKTGLYIETVSRGTVYSVTSLTRSGSTATATTSIAHQLRTTDRVQIRGAVQADYNVTNTPITVTGATTFTFTVPGSPTTPATGTVTAAQSRITDGLIVHSFGQMDNGHSSSGITGVGWGNNNAASFGRFVPGHPAYPAGLPTMLNAVSRQYGYALETFSYGDTTAAWMGNHASGLTLAVGVGPGISPQAAEGIRIYPITSTTDLSTRIAMIVSQTQDNLSTLGAASFVMRMNGETLMDFQGNSNGVGIGAVAGLMGTGTLNVRHGYFTNNAAPIFPSLGGSGLRLLTVSNTGQVGAAAIIVGFNGPVTVRDAGGVGDCTMSFVEGILVSSSC